MDWFQMVSLHILKQVAELRMKYGGIYPVPLSCSLPLLGREHWLWNKYKQILQECRNSASCYLHWWTGQYHISLTWIKAIKGDDDSPIFTNSPVRSQWRRYNLQWYVHVWWCRYVDMHVRSCISIRSLASSFHVNITHLTQHLTSFHIPTWRNM